MTRPVRVAVQIQPGGTPDYATWREAGVPAEVLRRAGVHRSGLRLAG